MFTTNSNGLKRLCRLAKRWFDELAWFKARRDPVESAESGRPAKSSNTFARRFPSMFSTMSFRRNALSVQNGSIGASAAQTPAEPERCVIVVDEALAPGKASNAAAVVAFTLGQRHSHLVGEPLRELDGTAHPGLIPIGIPVLKATAAQLSALRLKSLPHCDVVDFPVQGQTTTDYAALLSVVSSLPGESLHYLAVGLVGPRKKVGKLVGGLALFA